MNHSSSSKGKSNSSNSNDTYEPSTSNIKHARNEIDQVHNIMVDNVERVLERGERINLLVNKTDRMNANSEIFRRRTIHLRRSMMWQNIKFIVILVLCGLFGLFVLLGSICGIRLNECKWGDGEEG